MRHCDDEGSVDRIVTRFNRSYGSEINTKHFSLSSSANFISLVKTFLSSTGKKGFNDSLRIVLTSE